MKRVPPSMRMKEEVEALLRGDGPEEVAGAVPMEGFVRATARYMLQVAMEAEATAFLGRGHYVTRRDILPQTCQIESGLDGGDCASTPEHNVTLRRDPAA